MDKSGDEKPVSVRMSANLKNELARVADKEKRSMNQTFLFILERGLAAYERDGELFEPSASAETEEPATIRVPRKKLSRKDVEKKREAS